MDDRISWMIRQLPREQLERFAVRAALHVRQSQNEQRSWDFFLAALAGFLLGSMIAGLGFLLGTGLG
jgi:hypothetical protein